MSTGQKKSRRQRRESGPGGTRTLNLALKISVTVSDQSEAKCTSVLYQLSYEANQNSLCLLYQSFAILKLEFQAKRELIKREKLAADSVR